MRALRTAALAMVLAGVMAGMDLKLSLQVPQNPCRDGVECWVVFAIVNAGTNPARVHDPDPGRDHPPKLYLKAAGAPERELRLGRDVHADVLTLEPGKKVEHAFRLDRLQKLAPGRYEIRAVLDPLGINLRSKTVQLRFTAARK